MVCYNTTCLGGGCWVAILSGAVPVNFFSSTAFQGVGVVPGESSLGLVLAWRD